MIMNRRILIGLSVFIVSGIASAATDPPLRVFVSIQPQRYFVEKIGGDSVKIHVMVAPGASPATYEPKPRQMAELASATLYFAVGVPFERVWLEKFQAANRAMKVIPTQEGIELAPMAAHDHDGGMHDDGDHAGFKDPHIWLSPPLVMVQARNILAALQATDPAHAAQYRERYRRFIQEVAELDTTLMAIFEKKESAPEFLVFHPSWGYFARAYGLHQIPIEIEGKEPKPADILALVGHAREKHLTAVFVQPQFSRKSAETIAAAIGAEVVVIDPLAPDWADNLKRTAEAIGRAASRP